MPICPCTLLIWKLYFESQDIMHGYKYMANAKCVDVCSVFFLKYLLFPQLSFNA